MNTTVHPKDGLIPLLRKAQEGDWSTVLAMGANLTLEDAERSEALLLLGAARIYRLDGDRGEPLIERAIARLLAGRDLRNPLFWAAVETVAADRDMLARVAAPLGTGLVQARGAPLASLVLEGLLSVILADPMPPEAGRLKSLLMELVQGRSTLLSPGARERAAGRLAHLAADDEDFAAAALARALETHP